MQISLGRLELAGLFFVLRRLGEWWLKEILNLFPDRIAGLLAGRGRTLLVVSADHEAVTFELLDSSHASTVSDRTKPTDDVLAEVDRFLSARGLERVDSDIGLRLPAESVFSRQFLLPAEAMGSIDAVIAQDMGKKTPFKPEDVYSDRGAFERIDGNKIRVWQWITRRRYVEEALVPLKIDVNDIAFVVSGNAESGSPTPFINLRQGPASRTSWRGKAARALCCSAVILGALACGLKYWNQQTTIDGLGERIVAVSSKAQQVRGLVDQLQEKQASLLRLRLQRSALPGLIDLWEEVTRVLPSHSWLTELRLVETSGKREEQIAISGFSSAAPSLVGIIDGSPLFFDAALTSPIAFDASEGRERFALQAKVKIPAVSREASR